MTLTDRQFVPQNALIVASSGPVISKLRLKCAALGIQDIGVFDPKDLTNPRQMGSSWDLVIGHMDTPLGVHSFRNLQLCREHIAHCRIPMLVIHPMGQKSSFTIPQDSYALTQFREKDLTQDQFDEQVQLLMKESRWFHQSQTDLDVAFKNCSQDPLLFLEELRSFIAEHPRPEPLIILGAKALRAVGWAREAQNFLTSNLDRIGANRSIQIELGLNLIALGRDREAKEALEQAGLATSPHPSLNAPHDLRMAECPEYYLNPSETEFDEYRSASLNIYLRTNHSQSIPSSIANINNGLAIIQTRAGIDRSGIQFHLQSLSFPGSRQLKAKQCYNLGVAFLKVGDETEAFQWFEKAEALAPSKTWAQVYLESMQKGHGACRASFPKEILDITDHYDFWLQGMPPSKGA